MKTASKIFFNIFLFLNKIQKLDFIMCGLVSIVCLLTREYGDCSQNTERLSVWSLIKPDQVPFFNSQRLTLIYSIGLTVGTR